MNNSTADLIFDINTLLSMYVDDELSIYRLRIECIDKKNEEKIDCGGPCEPCKEEQICEDTDGGKDYYTQGSTGKTNLKRNCVRLCAQDDSMIRAVEGMREERLVAFQVCHG